jgi:hypothetical protein
MSYTYPEAITAMESVANDYIKLMRPNHYARVRMVCSCVETASVTWDSYSIRVTMPIRPATSIMTQAEFDDWIAYLLHELGHPTHTDKAAWEGACRAGLSRMTNALEDVREELATIKSGIVPNAKAVLSLQIWLGSSLKFCPGPRLPLCWHGPCLSLQHANRRRIVLRLRAAYRQPLQRRK